METEEVEVGDSWGEALSKVATPPCCCCWCWCGAKGSDVAAPDTAPDTPTFCPDSTELELDTIARGVLLSVS